MNNKPCVTYNPVGLLLVYSASLQLGLKFQVRGQEVMVEISKTAQLLKERRCIGKDRFVAN